MYDHSYFSRRSCLSRVFGHAQYFVNRSGLPPISNQHDTLCRACVFRSIYEVSRIIESCKSFFCSEIVHWDTSDCDRMDNLFPKHSQIYMETNEKHNKRKRTHKTSGLDENVKNLKELGHVLTHIAYKRMARYAERRNGLMNVFQSSSTLKILQQESHVCIILTSTRNHNTRCIGCILKKCNRSSPGYHFVLH